MSKMQWRMPQPGSPRTVRLFDGLTVADVAEVLEQPGERQLVDRQSELIVSVIAETALHVLVRVVLFRDDDSFVWWVRGARVATVADRDEWMKRG